MREVKAKNYLGREVSIKIDRQLGSKHPKHWFMYMLNYGFIPNTISGDGEELYAYLLGKFELIIENSGKVIAVIYRINDDVIRVLIEVQKMYFKLIIIK